MISGIQSGMSIDTTQMSQMREQMFAELDQNGDGLLEQTEMEAGRPSGPPPGRMSKMSGGERPEMPNFEEIFAQADIDGDGALSFEEFSSMKPPETNQMPTYSGLGQVVTAQYDTAGALLDILS